jgi:hypothetical protein
MEPKDSARVLVAAIVFILGGSVVGIAFSRLGLFLAGGAMLAILLDACDQLLAGRRTME